MTRPATPDAPAVRRLQYEGFPLESVLERVHEVHGAAVTIIGADRVRRGGVGGFFAREVFQVTVEVAADPVGPLPDVDAVDDEAVDDVAVDDVAVDDVAVDDVDLRDAPSADPAFADVDFDEIDPEDVDGALGLVVPSPGSDDEVWGLLAAAVARPTTTTDAPAAPAPPQAGAVVAAEDVVQLPDPALVLEPEVVAPLDLSGPLATTTLVPAAPAPAQVDLGALIADLDAQVRPAPDLPPAGIVAVVGARPHALEVAGRVADRLGIAADDVIVAAPSAEIVVPSADDTTRLAATTRFRCTPVAVIVVELVPGRQGHEWARAVLDGLRAEQVRFATDVAHLLDQQLSPAAVGGVDVFDLVGVAAHPSPTDVLGLGATIGTLDGRPATAEMWAALLLARHTVDRVAAGAR